jgi:hypothetical protein
MKTLAQLLRSGEVWREADHAPAGRDWREAVLAEFEHPVPAPARAAAHRREHVPLQARHIAVMAPAGLGLFLAGWLLGSGHLALERLAAAPPLAWIAGAAAFSLGVLAWRGLPDRLRRAR